MGGCFPLFYLLTYFMQSELASKGCNFFGKIPEKFPKNSGKFPESFPHSIFFRKSYNPTTTPSTRFVHAIFCFSRPTIFVFQSGFMQWTKVPILVVERNIILDMMRQLEIHVAQ